MGAAPGEAKLRVKGDHAENLTLGKVKGPGYGVQGLRGEVAQLLLDRLQGGDKGTPVTLERGQQLGQLIL
jgi:hypothetical protein